MGSQPQIVIDRVSHVYRPARGRAVLALDDVSLAVEGARTDRGIGTQGLAAHVAVLMAGEDDALDTFGVHAVGGTMGAFLTGVLARNSANANLATNLKDYVKDSCFQGLVWEQIKAIGVTLALAVVGTTVIALIVKAIVGLRPSEEVETIGLDLADHGEEGYHVESAV